MWASLASFILRNRVAIMITWLLLTAAMGYQALKVQISYEFARLLPDTDSTYVQYQRFKSVFGEDGAVMVIGTEDPGLFELKKIQGWYDLGEAVKHIKGIKEVVSAPRAYVLMRNDSLQRFDFLPVLRGRPATQADADSLKTKLLQLPFYKGFLYDEDHKAHLMAITFEKEMLNSKARLAMVDTIYRFAESFAAEHNLKLHYSGLPYIRTTIARKIAGEMTMFLGLAILVTAFILLVFFRSPTPVLFSLLVVVIGVIWSFGTIVLFGYKITALSGLIPPLIIVIGIPNCILMLNKYHQEYAAHGNQAKGLTRMVEKVGVSTFFANVTTSIGFAVFCFTKAEILVEFGLVASLNVMGTFITSLLLIPIFFSYLPPPSVKQIRHVETRIITQTLLRIDWWVHHYRKGIYAGVVVLLVLAAVGMSRIKAVGFVVDDLPKNDPIYHDLNFFKQHFKGVLPFEVSIDTRKPGGAMSMGVLYKINRLQKLFRDYPEFSKPISLAEAVKFANQAYNDGEVRHYRVPSATDLAGISRYVGGARKGIKTFRAFLDSTKQVTRISVQMDDVGSVRMKALVNELRPRIDSIFEPKEYSVILTGNSLMFLKGNGYLVRNLGESVLFAILLIALVMFTLFSSFRMVIISILPSVVPLCLTAGLMGWLGIPLKPSTILVFSIAFGIASDGNMYFLTKYRQELRRNHFSISRTVSLTLAETGVSMIYTAIILFCGFAIFMASGFGGTAALGLLISVTLLISYASNLILLPCFLLSLERRLISKAFTQEPLFEFWAEDEDISLDALKLPEKKSGKER